MFRVQLSVDHPASVLTFISDLAQCTREHRHITRRAISSSRCSAGVCCCCCVLLRRALPAGDCPAYPPTDRCAARAVCADSRSVTKMERTKVPRPRGGRTLLLVVAGFTALVTGRA
jgi:hypothetical protein